MSTAVGGLRPRKSPVQARSAVTVDALHVATIQVLTNDGLSRCTTTRIAERAGTSVGSLYQYYPNRDALLAAVLEKHLERVGGAVEAACRDSRGLPLSQMASALVAALLAEKLRNTEESRALYAIAEERIRGRIVARMHARTIAAVAELLASAPDVRLNDPLVTATIAFNALMGPVRTLLEGHAPPGFEAGLKNELTRLLLAYLDTYR